MVARWWLAPPLSSASAPEADEQNELENEDDVDEDDDDEHVERPFVAELIRFCWSELTKSSAIEQSWCESEPPRSDELDHGFELPTM